MDYHEFSIYYGILFYNFPRIIAGITAGALKGWHRIYFHFFQW